MQLTKILGIAEERKEYVMKPITLREVSSMNLDTNSLIHERDVFNTEFGSFFTSREGVEKHQYSIIDSAINQLLERVGIRRAYGNIYNNKLFENYSGTQQFLADMLQFGVKAHPEKPLKFLVDEDHNRVVGVVGSGYTQTPHYDILLPALEKFGEEINEHSSYINDKVMHVNFSPQIERKGRKVGDMVGFGPSIFNSDCGFSSVGIGLFALILRCTNGQVLPKKFIERRIIHNSHDPYGNFKKILDGFFTNNMGVEFMGFLDKVYDRPPLLITADELPTITRKYKIPQEYEEGLIDYLVNENDDLPFNTYGIFNAINGFASHHVSVEEDVETLMMAGFQILQIGVRY